MGKDRRFQGIYGKLMVKYDGKIEEGKVDRNLPSRRASNRSK
jgi:hypothetical protein